MSNDQELDKFKQLIHDIIFEDDVNIKINMLDYIDDLIHYEDFKNKVTDILNQSGVEIQNEETKLNKNDIQWTFTAKK